MGNHTVNKKEQKKEFIESAAGVGDSVKTTAMAIQNNIPHKLQIVVTNGKEAQNLPFMIEEGQIVSNSNVEVTIKAEDITLEQKIKRDNSKLEGTKQTKKDEEMTH